MADKRVTITTEVYPEQTRGPVLDRGIAAEDWRDGDHAVDLTGLKLYSRDPAWSPGIEPNWRCGWYLMYADGTVCLEIGGTHTPPTAGVEMGKAPPGVKNALVKPGPVETESQPYLIPGEPSFWLKRLLTEGRTGKGLFVLTDLQRHG